MLKFTDLEERALVQLFESSEGNGHDFGFTDELVLDNKSQNGPIVASLNKKGLFNLYADHVNGKPIVQLVFKDVPAIKLVVAEIRQRRGL